MAQRSSAADWGLFLLRIGAGLMLFGFHGLGKVTSAFAYFFQGQEWRFAAGIGNMGFPMPALFATLSVLAESLAALLMTVGLWTRYATAVVLINMSVAVYRHLTSDMRFEMAALYWLICVVILLGGPGALAVDARSKKRWGR